MHSLGFSCCMKKHPFLWQNTPSSSELEIHLLMCLCMMCSENTWGNQVCSRKKWPNQLHAICTKSVFLSWWNGAIQWFTITVIDWIAAEWEQTFPILVLEEDLYAATDLNLGLIHLPTDNVIINWFNSWNDTAISNLLLFSDSPLFGRCKWKECNK